MVYKLLVFGIVMFVIISMYDLYQNHILWAVNISKHHIEEMEKIDNMFELLSLSLDELKKQIQDCKQK